MNTLIVFVAVVAAVAAAPAKMARNKPANNDFPTNQAYYPGQQRGYYPGYPGYQGYYPGNDGYNRAGYYPGAPAYPVAPIAAPAPFVAPAPIVAPAPFVAPKAAVAPAPFAAPKAAVAPAYKAVDNKTPAIVRQSQEVNYDGNFSYGYETENGIVAQATGYMKNAGTDDAFQVIEGSYAYVGDDGAPVEVKYYADETGYHAVGNVVPTTPPEIARSLELIDSQPRKPEDPKSK